MSIEPSKISQTIQAFLTQGGFEFERAKPELFVVTLPGESKLKTAVSLMLGEHSLSINAFVMRAPDENQAVVHTWLLEQNPKLFAIAYALDQYGDIYVTGRLPLIALTEATLDGIFGAVHVAADENFNTLLQMGFATSIKKEWAWRVSRGEPLTNLQAFSELIESDG